MSKEIPRENIPETIPRVQEVARFSESEFVRERHIVGLVVATELDRDVPTHISVIGSSSADEPWKAWSRARNIMKHQGLPKIEFTVLSNGELIAPPAGKAA